MGMDSMQEERIDVAVIGGGASGMAAAIAARRKLSESASVTGNVTVFERNDRVGRKLLMTGNGRCNLTNLDTDLRHYHGNDVRFSKGALLRYSPAEIISFFEELGVICTTEENQKVYPASLHAASVLDALRLALDELAIDIVTDARVVKISRNPDGFLITLADSRVFRASSVIAACGGMCAPATGSDGSGYKLLTDFSHTLRDPVPSIVQLKTETGFCKPLSGNKIFGNVSLYINGKMIREEYGEILFTDYGLSGPPVLQLSGYVSRALAERRPDGIAPSIYLLLDFMPAYSEDEVRSMMYMRKSSFANRKLDDFLVGIFHKRLALGLLRQATDKQMTSQVSSLSERELQALCSACKSMRVQVLGTMPFVNAQTTAGGISTDDFDPSTMASAKCPGLFACGEILDIDGDCGGFNLQWAWSSGFLAGTSAAQYVKREGKI